MPKPRPSVLKRQREQAKRERKVAKAERKAQRSTDEQNGLVAPEDEFEYPEQLPVDEELIAKLIGKP